MNKKRLRKNVENLKQILDRNRSKTKRLIVSHDFMLTLKEVADIVDLRSETESETKQHDFAEVHATYTEDEEAWYLWDIPVMFSNTIKVNALLQLDDDQTIVIEGITGYKNK